MKPTETSAQSDAFHLRLAKTSLGWVAVVATVRGVHWVTLAPGEAGARKEAQKRFASQRLLESAEGSLKDAPPAGLENWVAAVVGMIERPASIWKAPLDLTGTEFQRAVWQALQKIPAGSVLTYAELARRIGRPRAFRAVGSACGANPVPFLVPCHRVVASSGRLGGFGLGLPVKQALLEREGVL